MAPTPNEQLIVRLVKTVPGLRGAYDEHMRFTDGELLPHVCLSELTHVLEQWTVSGSDQARDEVRRAVAILEEAFGSGNSDVLDLVSLSFIENLDAESAAYPQIRLMMGPGLRGELARYEGR